VLTHVLVRWIVLERAELELEEVVDSLAIGFVALLPAPFTVSLSRVCLLPSTFEE
jgi:hypothetical protein